MVMSELRQLQGAEIYTRPYTPQNHRYRLEKACKWGIRNDERNVPLRDC
jgi:hypothetical protein